MSGFRESLPSRSYVSRGGIWPIVLKKSPFLQGLGITRIGPILSSRRDRNQFGEFAKVLDGCCQVELVPGAIWASQA